uniref:Uncharacterized protein n=1 Tax=Electrophorus electricus TaxID=8005 RepID=A0A4W4GM93_ELEEL
FSYNIHIDITVFSFSFGISKTHRSLESISSSGLASFHFMSGGAIKDCTINLCLLFSLGS